MRNKKSNRAPAFTVVHFALILLCLVLVSTYATMGLHASYKSGATGTDSARVAKFDVDVTGSGNDAVAVHTSQAANNTCTITIANKSEVAVRYTLKVSDIPDVVVTFSSTEGTLGVGVGAEAATHTLTFTVSDWNAVTKDMTNEKPNVSLNFTVTVDVEQID